MQDSQSYTSSERARISLRYNAKYKNGFKTKADLSDWYCNQLVKQDFCCYYCETSIFVINQLIEGGLINARLVGAGGKGCRGKVLEIEKVINGNGYNAENCVLACYYCNNDKSYTMDGADYKFHFGLNRKKFFIYASSILLVK